MNRHLAALALMLAPFSLHAHPHVWNDVRSTIIMSTDGLLMPEQTAEITRSLMAVETFYPVFQRNKKLSVS